MTTEREKTGLLIQTVITEISIIAQLSTARLSKVLPGDMTPAQFGVLNHFARLGGYSTPARLAAAFQITRGAMTNTLKRLENKQLVDIKPDLQDGRRKLVTMTARGAKARLAALAKLAPYIASLTNTHSPEQFAAALPFLRSLRTTLDEERNERDFGKS